MLYMYVHAMCVMCAHCIPFPRSTSSSTEPESIVYSFNVRRRVPDNETQQNSLCECMYVNMCVCECVCCVACTVMVLYLFACEDESLLTHRNAYNTYTRTFMRVTICVHVYACVRVCVRVALVLVDLILHVHHCRFHCDVVTIITHNNTHSE